MIQLIESFFFIFKIGCIHLWIVEQEMFTIILSIVTFRYLNKKKSFKKLSISFSMFFLSEFSSFFSLSNRYITLNSLSIVSIWIFIWIERNWVFKFLNEKMLKLLSYWKWCKSIIYCIQWKMLNKRTNTIYHSIVEIMSLRLSFLSSSMFFTCLYLKNFHLNLDFLKTFRMKKCFYCSIWNTLLK